MASNSNNESPKPKSLKTLAFNVKYSDGNNLLHQFVLNNSDPNNPRSENYINAVLRSMSNAPVNALNGDGFSALHLAVMKKNLFMIEKLLSCLTNIDVNIPIFFDGCTALHLAVQSDNLSLVHEFINKGVDVNERGIENQTLLHHSIYLEVIKLLVNSGANVNAEDDSGYTALHYAARTRNLDTVEFLVSNGADLNAVAFSDNHTPLHEAAFLGDLNTVEFLVDSGARVNAIDAYGKTPLHVAWSTEIFEYLQDKVGRKRLKTLSYPRMFPSLAHIQKVKFRRALQERRRTLKN